MMPAQAPVVFFSELVRPWPPTATMARRSRSASATAAGRRFGHRFLPWSLALLSLAAAVGLGVARPADLSGRVRQLEGRLASAQSEVESAAGRAAAAKTAAVQAQDRASQLATELRKLEAAKIRTVIKTKTVTKTVPRWVPNGRRVAVEVTGFEGLIAIHDVQLTHSYGYSDLIGIAVNRSGRTISYVQLGCTFLDANGRVAANEITNKQSWAPGATWGFVCSGQTDATGGILRVDEMS